MTKRTIYTLNLGGTYAPEITRLTYPFMKLYAEKIDAEFYMITERKFPEWPAGVEKLQVFDLARERGDEWAYFFDSDVLIHPDLFPIDAHVLKDTVVHNACDVASHRWKYDRYFQRDGRHISSCNWFAMMSEWCIDMYHPPDDITYAEALARIRPVSSESRAGMAPGHLCDDFLVSRNIAKYGLHFTTVMNICEKLNVSHACFFHEYNTSDEDKAKHMKARLTDWKLMAEEDDYAPRRKKPELVEA